MWRGPLRQDGALGPVIRNAVNAWEFSRRGGRKRWAWEFYTEVPCTMAGLIGGQPLVDDAMPGIRMLVERLMAEDEARDEVTKGGC